MQCKASSSGYLSFKISSTVSHPTSGRVATYTKGAARQKRRAWFAKGRHERCEWWIPTARKADERIAPACIGLWSGTWECRSRNSTEFLCTLPAPTRTGRPIPPLPTNLGPAPPLTVNDCNAFKHSSLTKCRHEHKRCRRTTSTVCRPPNVRVACV